MVAQDMTRLLRKRCNIHDTRIQLCPKGSEYTRKTLIYISDNIGYKQQIYVTLLINDEIDIRHD